MKIFWFPLRVLPACRDPTSKVAPRAKQGYNQARPRKDDSTMRHKSIIHRTVHTYDSSNTGGAFISYLVHAGGASPRSALLLVETAQGTTPRRFTGTHSAAPCGRRLARAEADQHDDGHFICIFISWSIGWTCTLIFFRFSAHDITIHIRSWRLAVAQNTSEYTDKGRFYRS
jgi:hypothetical protein